ncbi:MAG: hypothetical protein AB1772_02505 [Candidatus Zixiibacteriota bacterium]
MIRDSILLGFLATSSQVLLLRELITAFGGAELLVGTALFGWLIWVALGAWLGGRRANELSPRALFVLGVFLVPVALVAVRFSPLLVTTTIGEAIPLTTAIPLSIVAVAPVGVLAGWLFPVVARKGRSADTAIGTVYLFEGLGAFLAGIFLTVLVGASLGNLGLCYSTGMVILPGAAIGAVRHRWLPLSAAAVVLVLIIATGAGRSIDHACDRAKFTGYVVEQSFDTPYGHQVLLSRDSSIVLITDNTVEATSGDIETSENLLIPPISYSPTAQSALLIGRAEFGFGSLVSKLGGLRATAVDPRVGISGRIDTFLPVVREVSRINQDPVAYLSGSTNGAFDVVIVKAGRLDTYRNSRVVTRRFFDLVRRTLNPEGVLVLATGYDTDRYVSAGTADLLATIASTLRGSFAQVIAWPGTETLLLASDRADLDLPFDTILARIEDLPYETRYVNEAYLGDRLGIMKTERIEDVLAMSQVANSIAQPRLATKESWYRARASQADRSFARIVLGNPYWLTALPLGLLTFLWWAAKSRDSTRVGLFLYVTAGLVSLSLELVSFYLYQSTAGSLYVHLAMLVGVFMLGLSLGTWLAARTVGQGLGVLSVATLLAATIALALTWHRVDFRLALIYHLLFLFVVALATGSLFIAATRSYYAAPARANRGLGYAAELCGSALGALLTTTVLLPIIGVYWLLISLGALLVLALLLQVRPKGRRRPV